MSRTRKALIQSEKINAQGDALFEQEEYEQALTCFLRAIELVPDNAQYQFNAGISLARLDRHAEALPHFDRALADPDAEDGVFDFEWYLSRADSLRAQERFEEALSDIARLLAVEESVGALVVRARILYQLRRLDEAIATWQRVITLEPTDGDHYLALAEAYLDNGDPARAVIEANRAIAFAPKAPLGYFARGLAYRGLGRDAAAARDRRLGAERVE